MTFASIVVVDDDDVFRKSLGRLLRGAGYAVDEAVNGRQASELLKLKVRDLLVTDIIMPDGDGIELISAARRAHPGMPIVAISGRVFLGSLDMLRLAAVLGADATLQKPLDAEQFLAKVAHLLAQNRQSG